MHNTDRELIEKVQNLEEKLAYQEDTIESLNQSMGLQYQEIQLLNQKIKLLSDYIKSLKAQGDSGIKRPDEEIPPPHY